MLVSFFLAALLSVAQQPYTYQSNVILIPEKPTFVVKAEVPIPTPKHALSKPEGAPLSAAEGHTLSHDDGMIERREGPRPPLLSKPLKIEIKEIEAPSIIETKREAKAEVIDSKKKTQETVYFDLDSCILKESEKLKLDSLDRSKTYEIVGYTCDLGSKSYNDSLALKRAVAVRDYLGVDGKAQGNGKCCYLDKKDRAKNRRVEVKQLSGN